MIEALQERVNADQALIRRGRYLTTTFLVETGDTAWLISVFEGVRQPQAGAIQPVKVRSK
jgi:hypothetical protein